MLNMNLLSYYERAVFQDVISIERENVETGSFSYLDNDAALKALESHESWILKPLFENELKLAQSDFQGVYYANQAEGIDAIQRILKLIG